MEYTDVSPGMMAGGIVSMIGFALMVAGGIGSFVCWIMAIIKAFQANDTLWGVLTIFINICGIIWLFMNGHKKLGVWWVIFAIAAIAGIIMVYGGMFGAMAAGGAFDDINLEPTTP